MASERITNPNVKPWLAPTLNILLPGAGGYIYLGQYKKAVMFFVLTVVLSCVVFGLVFPIIGAVDAYLLAKVLEDGGSIGRDENALALLDKMFQ
ncbi:MAG: hypothetical protein H6741_29170 [Alphaproteobacteria bacterium]|nr:hypothetical protein [Alphaproteobacteria bacterium]MCB9796791.1 hypothetical protein [Alphaproteobacteria bacterium]